jgi:outer membrane protein OmpA-like peptidoglycan-associated protein
MNCKPCNLDEAAILKARRNGYGHRSTRAILCSLSASFFLAAGLTVPGCVTTPRQATAGLPGYSFEYTLKDRQATGLIQVFDDGQKTYLQFTDWSHEAPTIIDGNNTPLSFERSGPYAVVTGRHASLIVNVQGAESAVYASSSGHDVKPRIDAAPAATATVDDVQQKEAEIDAARTRIAALEQQLAEARTMLLPYVGRAVIRFENNSARITVDRETVRAIAEVMRERAPILVAGYTDATYPDAAGETLARRRAQRVQEALVAEGVPASHIDIAYHSAGWFAVDNHTPAGRALNRRVEIMPNADVTGPSVGSDVGNFKERIPQ